MRVRHERGDRAFYNMQTDTVTLPEREQFASADGYYQTAFHELGHATGHPNRLDRDTLQQGAGKFGSVEYAREELRAELSAMLTGARVGVGHDGSRGAAYVQGWLTALEHDPQEIYQAAADAQHMSDSLLRPIRAREQQTAQEDAALAEKYSAARGPQISSAPPARPLDPRPPLPAGADGGPEQMIVTPRGIRRPDGRGGRARVPGGRAPARAPRSRTARASSRRSPPSAGPGARPSGSPWSVSRAASLRGPSTGRTSTRVRIRKPAGASFARCSRSSSPWRTRGPSFPAARGPSTSPRKRSTGRWASPTSATAGARRRPRRCSCAGCSRSITSSSGRPSTGSRRRRRRCSGSRRSGLDRGVLPYRTYGEGAQAQKRFVALKCPRRHGRAYGHVYLRRSGADDR